ILRLEPMNGRVVNVVRERDLAQRLAGRHALQRLARLVLGELWLATKPRALSHGAARPSLVRCRIRSRSNSALWANRWRQREATGDMVIVRYADDCAPRRREEEANM